MKMAASKMCGCLQVIQRLRHETLIVGLPFPGVVGRVGRGTSAFYGLYLNILPTPVGEVD